MEFFKDNTALIAAIFSGAGVALVKAIETWVVTKEESAEKRQERLYRESVELREELKLQIKELESIIKKLQSEVSKWKAKYWELYSKYVQKTAELTILKEELENLSRRQQEE